MRRSWLAHATSSRRASNRRSRLAAISLKDAARSATSAGPDSGARTLRSPAATCADASRTRSTEREIERARTRPAITATVADAGRDGEDLDVVAHVERHPAGEQHGREREADGERGEAGELQPQAREEAKEHDRAQPDRERRARRRRGRSRSSRRASRARAGSRRPTPSGDGAARTDRPRSSPCSRRTCTVTVPVSSAASYPQTRLMSWSRPKTRRGWLARNQRRSNSFAVRRTSTPAFRTSRVARVELDVAEGEPLGGRLGGAGAPKHGSHACRELARGERLRHVVVRAELEPDDPVGLLAARGQHDHGQLRARADPPAELQAVRSGQHDVEHHEVGRLALDERTGVVAVVRLERRVALALEVAHDDLAHDRLVVDDEDGGHGPHGACAVITHG